MKADLHIDLYIEEAEMADVTQYYGWLTYFEDSENKNFFFHVLINNDFIYKHIQAGTAQSLTYKERQEAYHIFVKAEDNSIVDTTSEEVYYFFNAPLESTAIILIDFVHAVSYQNIFRKFLNKLMRMGSPHHISRYVNLDKPGKARHILNTLPFKNPA